MTHPSFGISSGFVRGGANVNKGWLSKFMDKAMKSNLPIPSNSTPLNPPIELRASPSAPADMSVGPTKVDRAQARQSGYTGDQCDNCSSMKMKISGHCMVCEDCGTTTGCS